MRSADTVVLLFAKAPVEGEVNTRLIPDIGVEAATQLQHELIEHRLEMLSQSELADIELHCLPDTQHECFVAAHKNYPVTLRQQDGSVLGERMFNAVTVALKSYRHCILLGTDAPALDAVAIGHAIDVLRSGMSVVIAPAEDGGYVMLGLSKAYRCLFQDIAWGTENVMQQSRDALAMNGIEYQELASCWDIDRVEDYLRYQDFKPG
jgi:rSAM/selenodomain-associated transferase 1